MPPNDPRYLEATDSEILEDMLVSAYQNRRVALQACPTAVLAEDSARDPAVGDAMLKRKERFMSDPGVQRALHRLLQGGRTDEEVEQATRPLRLSLGTTLVEATP